MAVAECHPNKFAKGRGLCGTCYDKWLKDANPEYRKRQIDNTSAWFRRNPDARKTQALKRKLKEQADPSIRRAALLKRNYGLTLQSYAEMLEQQNGSCVLCHRKPGKRPLHVDHNHLTGKVRGLLCHQCNWYLGIIEADEMILNRITEYLAMRG